VFKLVTAASVYSVYGSWTNMNTQHWWNYILQWKQKYLEKKLSQYHSAHNTSHRNCSGID